jgi:hypothetical protein
MDFWREEFQKWQTDQMVQEVSQKRSEFLAPQSRFQNHGKNGRALPRRNKNAALPCGGRREILTIKQSDGP